MAATERRTLYEDWKSRREQIDRLPYWAGDQRAAEAQILDYLLRRYRDTPEGNRPARSPAAYELYVNDRAIVVMRHLGGGSIPTMTTAQEAQAHVEAVLKERLHKTGWRAARARREAQAGQRSTSPGDPAEAVRVRLCHNHPIVRVLAILRLGEIGTLDDIGLFSDLLALPPCANEHPRERPAMLHSMWRLAGEMPEPFDLSDVIGPPPSPTTTAPSAGHEEDPSASESATEVKGPPWLCPKCGKGVPGNFWICWNCGTYQDGVEDPEFRGMEEE